MKKLLDAIADEYDKTTGNLIYDLLKAFAIVMSNYDTKLNEIQDLIDVDNLYGTMLETYVYQRKGIQRNQATYSIGQLQVSGNGTVTIGDLFETKSGIQFKSTETKVINGTGKISVQAVTAGINGNVPANQILQMPVTISGITSVTNPEPTHDGFDAETDESLKQRYYVAVRTPATSNNVYHYRQWALSVAGVGDCKVFPLARGENTVEIYIIDKNKLPAGETLVKAVQDYIDPDSTGLGNGEASIGNYTYVLPAIGQAINLSLVLTVEDGYTDEQVKENIEENIRQYLALIAFKQNYVSYAAIGNTIYETNGVKDYSNLLINNGTDNINTDDKAVSVLGSVTLA